MGRLSPYYTPPIPTCWFVFRWRSHNLGRSLVPEWPPGAELPLLICIEPCSNSILVFACVLPLPWGFSCKNHLWLSKTHKKLNHLWPFQMYKISSLGCLEIVHSHLKNLYNGTSSYHLFFNCHFFSPCSLEGLPSTHFIDFPIFGVLFFIPYLFLLWQLIVCWQSSGSWPITTGLWIHSSPGTRGFSQFLGLLNKRGKRNTHYPCLRPLCDSLNTLHYFYVSFFLFLV